MSKVTSKLQVTIPKAIAAAFGIAPGDTLAWIPAGDGIRVVPDTRADDDPIRRRLALFDEATRRQEARKKPASRLRGPRERGWSREELYDRGGDR